MTWRSWRRVAALLTSLIAVAASGCGTAEGDMTVPDRQQPNASEIIEAPQPTATPVEFRAP